MKWYANKVACLFLGHVWMWREPWGDSSKSCFGTFCGSCGKPMTGGRALIKEVRREMREDV